jgi:uncharacterized Zn-finger protein
MNYRLFVPLFVTILVSLGIGYALSDFISMWKGAIAGLIVQFIIRYVVDTIKKKEPPSEIEEIMQDVIDIQTTPITCPCGKNTFYAPIFLNKENMFQCDKCGSKFRAEINIDTILLTEPVNLQNAFDHLKRKEL